MDENNHFAKDFIGLWQGNFEKMMSSDANMRQMQQQMQDVLGKMQGLYGNDAKNESATAADSNAHGDGDDALLVRALSRRVDELEQRLKRLERTGD